MGNHKLVPVTLAVPDVVIAEVTNKFSERLTKTTAALREGHKELKLLVSDAKGLPEMPSVERETARYREFLLQRILEVGGLTLPYPKTSHETIVKRELQRRKPFKENGSGYRDLLIWESLRELTRSGHERIAFITANVRDFFDDARLHQDLAADVLNPDRVEVFSSLKQFNEKHVIPRLETVERFDKELRAISSSSADVSTWIRDNLLEILRWDEIGYAISPVPDAGHFYASEIVSFDDFKMTSARKLDGGGLLCSASVTSAVDVSIDIDEQDHCNHEEFSGWPIGSWNEVFLVAVELDITVNPNDGAVSSYEVTSIDVAEAAVQAEITGKVATAEA